MNSVVEVKTVEDYKQELSRLVPKLVRRGANNFIISVAEDEISPAMQACEEMGIPARLERDYHYWHSIPPEKPHALKMRIPWERLF